MKKEWQQKETTMKVGACEVCAIPVKTVCLDPRTDEIFCSRHCAERFDAFNRRFSDDAMSKYPQKSAGGYVFPTKATEGR